MYFFSWFIELIGISYWYRRFRAEIGIHKYNFTFASKYYASAGLKDRGPVSRTFVKFCVVKFGAVKFGAVKFCAVKFCAVKFCTVKLCHAVSFVLFRFVPFSLVPLSFVPLSSVKLSYVPLSTVPLVHYISCFNNFKLCTCKCRDWAMDHDWT